jgi:hypothetical protein
MVARQTARQEDVRSPNDQDGSHATKYSESVTQNPDPLETLPSESAIAWIKFVMTEGM